MQIHLYFSVYNEDKTVTMLGLIFLIQLIYPECANANQLSETLVK